MNRGDFRQWRSQTNQMISDATELRRQLAQSGGQATDLRSVDDVIKTLREMGSDRLEGNPTGLQELTQAALEKMQKLDLDLRKRTDLSNDQLFLSSADEAPPQYRPLVDEYFKKLSKESGARGAVKK